MARSRRAVEERIASVKGRSQISNVTDLKGRQLNSHYQVLKSFIVSDEIFHHDFTLQPNFYDRKYMFIKTN
jgi:hypothetical protein